MVQVFDVTEVAETENGVVAPTAAACACRGAWAVGPARSALDGGASWAAEAGKTDTHIAPTAATTATASRRGLGIVSI